MESPFQEINALKRLPAHTKTTLANETPTDHLNLIVAHAAKALIRDRGEPATETEHLILMRDAELLAQTTWMAIRGNA